jgi:hypothetical protein
MGLHPSIIRRLIFVDDVYGEEYRSVSRTLGDVEVNEHTWLNVLTVRNDESPVVAITERRSSVK